MLLGEWDVWNFILIIGIAIIVFPLIFLLLRLNIEKSCNTFQDALFSFECRKWFYFAWSVIVYLYRVVIVWAYFQGLVYIFFWFFGGGQLFSYIFDGFYKSVTFLLTIAVIVFINIKLNRVGRGLYGRD